MTPPPAPPRLSVVVPTFNERENLAPLAARVDAACRAAAIDYEIVVVDDDSPDGTAAEAERLGRAFPLRAIVRRGGARGLATAVVCGFRAARGDAVAAIDADLSHPPERLPALARPVLEGAADMTVGSRYVAGGAVDAAWPLYRRLASRVAIALARPLAPVRDATSGFFCVRRDLLENVDLRPIGYKIGLEVIVRARPRRILEIPIEFRDRAAGRTKFGLREQVLYLRHLLRLYPARFFARR